MSLCFSKVAQPLHELFGAVIEGRGAEQDLDRIFLRSLSGCSGKKLSVTFLNKNKTKVNISNNLS